MKYHLTEIEQHEDIEYESGTTGHIIYWNLTAGESPNYFEVYHNERLVRSEAWNGSDITHSIDGLSIGTHEFRLIVYDWLNIPSISSVRVKVIDSDGSDGESSPSTADIVNQNFTMIATISILSLTSIFCLLIFQKRIKR